MELLTLNVVMNMAMKTVLPKKSGNKAKLFVMLKKRLQQRLMLI
jgi:hypothetical protein